MPQPFQAKFDWLEVTIKKHSPQEVMNFFELTPKEFHKLDRGRFGYNTQLKWEKGHVYYNSEHGQFKADNMGVHVLMTGQGCDALAGQFPIRIAILSIIGHGDYKFTRLDLAIDDLQERYLSLKRIHHYRIHQLISSQWTNVREINNEWCVPQSS